MSFGRARALREIDAYRTVDELERNLGRVDVYLKYGVETLLAIAKNVKEKSASTTIPPWVSERTTAGEEHYPLCHALVAATLQKVWHQRRRFGYLETRHHEIIKWLPTPFTTSAADPATLEFLTELDSRAFGALNPLTASEVLRALLHTSDEATLSSRGMLALFAVLWALGRRHGETAAAGAALEPWKPTATVTAKCVFTLSAFARACEHRTDLFSRLRENLADLRKQQAGQRVIDHWEFCRTADRLAATIQEFAGVVSCPDPLRIATGDILAIVGALKSTTPQADYQSAFTSIEAGITTAFAGWRLALKGCLAALDPLLNTLFPTVVGLLSVPNHKTLTNKYCRQFNVGDDPEYWADQQRSATQAVERCRKIVEALRIAIDPAAPGSFDDFLRTTAAAYKESKDCIDEALRPCIRWCQIVVRDQIAHASAGNDTEFDAAELVSATAVCGLWPSFSQLETRDAIQKSRAGSRADGSWTRGQPIYLHERVLGAWPATPDIVWMLCTALDNYPDVADVDDILLRFIDWLERTLNLVVHSDYRELRGWSSELYRDEHTIDVWTTAVTVNALLEIRDILEQRALQLCARRFTVIRKLDGLDEVLPVDLGAEHRFRMHHRLFNAVRETRISAPDAEYSFVLHGPPGSSKTILANAVAAEMWERRRTDGRPLLIRVTPADFTRQGSDRLDGEARFIFRLLSMTRRVTILFDEIDELLRERLTPGEATFFKLVVPAMLNRLQDLRDIAPRQEIAFILGTNFIDRIDPALIRRGRMDAVIAVPYPDAYSRIAICEKADVDVALCAQIEAADGLPYSVIKDIAKRLKNSGSLNMRQDDRTQDVDQHYADVRRWNRKSPALLSEFLRGTAARRSNQAENEKHIKTMAKSLSLTSSAKKSLLIEFRAMCDREGRLATAKLGTPATP